MPLQRPARGVVAATPATGRNVGWPRHPLTLLHNPHCPTSVHALEALEARRPRRDRPQVPARRRAPRRGGAALARGAPGGRPAGRADPARQGTRSSASTPTARDRRGRRDPRRASRPAPAPDPGRRDHRDDRPPPLARRRLGGIGPRLGLGPLRVAQVAWLRVAVDITLFTDPACPFAFSAEPVRQRLRWHYGDQLRWRLT